MRAVKHMEAKTIKGGGVTSAQGFQAAGVACGIKPRGEKDMALIVSDVPAEAAATFTTNLVKAAPVKVSMKHLRNGKMHGVVINSGCANACTGVGGIADAMAMVVHTAKQFDSKPREWLICSTGRIGNRLPMVNVRKGIEKAAAKLDHAGGVEAAKAIMTTDTRRKEFAMRFKVDGRKVTIGGMAKGAGMIHPNMATMLCVITTDAKIDKAALKACVDDAVEHSFNRISVDGDTSTNDTVIVMANGISGTNQLKSFHPQYPMFKKTLTHVMRKLARMIVEDGEGITRVVDVAVKGAASVQDAKLAALAVAKSELIKTSWTGGDPNWGRIMAALGYSGARVREEMVEIFYDGLVAVINGQPSKTPVAKLRKLVRKPKFTITIHLHSGVGEYSILTTDLTEEYVRINKRRMMRNTKADALLEALPYFQQFRGKTVVVKYGGAAMENPDLVESVMRDIVFLETVGINPVVVHGGGKAITAAMRQENLTAKFIDGLRVTDQASIKIIDRVLTEVISPSLAGKIREFGGQATILSGKDVMVAEKAPLRVDATGAKVDLGLIGTIIECNIAQVQKLIDQEIVPIISPLGVGRDGQVYNINADIAAAKIAQALKAHKIIYLSDVNGVRRDPKDENSLISTLTPAQIQSLKQQGVIASGMIPKVDSALEALAGGVGKVHFLDGKQAHSLLLELFTDAGIGTEIAASK